MEHQYKGKIKRNNKNHYLIQVMRTRMKVVIGETCSLCCFICLLRGKKSEKKTWKGAFEKKQGIEIRWGAAATERKKNKHNWEGRKAINVEEIRLPWMFPKYKDNLLGPYKWCFVELKLKGIMYFTVLDRWGKDSEEGYSTWLSTFDP